MPSANKCNLPYKHVKKCKIAKNWFETLQLKSPLGKRHKEKKITESKNVVVGKLEVEENLPKNVYFQQIQIRYNSLNIVKPLSYTLFTTFHASSAPGVGDSHIKGLGARRTFWGQKNGFGTS